MNAWIESANALSAAWAPWLWRACWQGAIVIGVAWLITLAMQNGSPRLRSWIWRLAYLKLLLLLVWTTPIQLALLPAEQQMAVTHGAEQPIASHDAGSGRDVLTSNSRGLLDQPAAAGNARATKAGDLGGETTQPPAIAAQSQLSNQSHFNLNTALFMVWFVGLVVVLTLFAFDAWQAWRFVRSAYSFDDPQWLATCREVCQCMGVTRKVRLRVSDSASGPLLVRFVSPAIVIPERFVDQLTCDEARLVLAHELAHLRRHDLGWNSLLALVHAVLYFHPLVWLAHHFSRRSRKWHATS